MPEGMITNAVFRWIHLLAGITWIGLLYFFNLVNVRFMAALEGSAKPHVIPTLLPRALAWFRHAAWVTVLAGLILIYNLYFRPGILFTSPGGQTIFLGGLLGVIMMLNVWIFIWPNQNKIIAATRDGRSPDPAWGKTALFFSRTNFVLSFPMLLYMGGAGHAPMPFATALPVGLAAALIGWIVVMSVQKWGAARF